MQNYEVVLWSLVASLIRVLKDYIQHNNISIFKSIFIVSAGVASATLFSLPLINALSLSLEYVSPMSFIVGLLGKEIVEILLTIDLRKLIFKILNIDDYKTNENSEDSSTNNRRTKSRKR